MSDSESFSPTSLNVLPPVTPTSRQTEPVNVNSSRSEDTDDYDTTPTPSEEQNQSYSRMIPRPKPIHPELDFVNLDMNRASSITEAELDQLRTRFNIPDSITLSIPKD